MKIPDYIESNCLKIFNCSECEIHNYLQYNFGSVTHSSILEFLNMNDKLFISKNQSCRVIIDHLKKKEMIEKNLERW